MFFFTTDAVGNILMAGNCQEEVLSAYEADGIVVREGQADPLRQYFNLLTNELANYSPEQIADHMSPPGPDFHWSLGEWIDERTEAQATAMQVADLKRQIVAIEARQPRAIREAVLANDTTYLDEIEAEIAPLRAQIQALTPGGS